MLKEFFSEEPNELLILDKEGPDRLALFASQKSDSRAPQIKEENEHDLFPEKNIERETVVFFKNASEKLKDGGTLMMFASHQEQQPNTTVVAYGAGQKESITKILIPTEAAQLIHILFPGQKEERQEFLHMPRRKQITDALDKNRKVLIYSPVG